MGTLELLTVFAPQHVREPAFRIAFPDENKATFLLAKLLAEEAGTTLDINQTKAAEILGVTPRMIHNWLDDVSCDELLGRKKKSVK